jgi:alpha-mannosidase
MRWTVEKIGQRIALVEPLVYRKRTPLPSFRFLRLASPMEMPPTGVDVDDTTWEVIEPDRYWAGVDTNFVLRSTFEIPLDWERGFDVALFLPLGVAGTFSHPEALAYIDGTAYATCDRHHQEFRLNDGWRDGKAHTLALHGWTGNLNWEGMKHRLLMQPCEVVQIDQPTRDFLATARVALGVARTLDEHEPAKGLLLNALDDAFKVLDTREPFGARFYDSVLPAHQALKDGIAAAGPALDVTVSASGHAHIDVAWLWTLGQTRRKAGRTFHTVLRLMEQFPDYHFTQSQPQVYDYVRQDYPPLFEAIKGRVAEGRWELIGGMWIEADCNLSGAESLARQFLLGRRFFREHFGEGIESPVLWLPDVFGYAWALPQLIKQAGLEYFFTIKIGWSQYNRLPYDSFWWQGLDGTRVLTHFSTTKEPGSPYASTYNAAANAEETIGTWMNFQQKETQQDLLMAFGYGDGGGGPTREMLENLRELANFPGAPRARQRAVGDFFRDMETRYGDSLPSWNGELYLEYHRGTYTTQSRNKRANRKNEFLLHDAEFLAALASTLDSAYTYPTDTFRQAWELVCLNQFHDIIPGSSINAVYVESLQQYDQICTLATTARDTALAAVAAKVGGDLLVINPTSFTRGDLAFWPQKLGDTQSLHHVDGTPVRVQHGDGGTWIDLVDIAPFSVVPLTFGEYVEIAPPETGVTATPSRLENYDLLVEFDDFGDIVRIYDKKIGREVLTPGKIANQLQAFEDRPKFWDAWDIDIFYDDKMWTADAATSIEVVESGPLRATIEIRRRILNSDVVQRISLTYNSTRVNFDTSINWRERHILLKTAFPVEIASPVATYDIQWGNVERPTHHNTSWDWARFETCAQKWVDLSEGDYGVSLLNDCKYGHDIRDNVMRISLLRSPTSPDPEADQGQHQFSYSLFPHADRWGEKTVAAAYALNDPLIVWNSSQPVLSQTVLNSLVAVDRPNVIIETVKRAEDGNGLIVRLYENQRRRGTVTLKAGFPLQRATRTNLLEDNQDSLTVEGNSVRLYLKPYEIVTLRLE